MTLTLGAFGQLNPSPIHGWNVDTLDFIPVSVDASGAIITAGGGGGSTVDQGTGGVSAWLVTGPLTDTQLRASDVPVSVSGSVPVTGTFWQATQPVSGSLSVSNFPASQAVTGTFWQATQPVSGTVTANPTYPATSTVTTVSASASSVTLKASNASRRGLMVYNDSSVVLYLKCGATASTSSFTVAMAANSYYEVPQPCYTGVVDGIWASATGAARVTEIT